MKNSSARFISRVILSFMIAFILVVLPLPTWLWWWRPAWVALVLMYWVLEFPRQVSYGTAFVIGIVYDVLIDTVLGQHAFGLLFIVAVIRSLAHVLRTLSVVQQALLMLPLLFFYELLIVLIQGMLGQLNDVGWFWLRAVMGALTWPWIYWLLADTTQSLRRRII